MEILTMRPILASIIFSLIGIAILLITYFIIEKLTPENTWSQISKVVIGARDEKRGFINKNLQLHPKTELIIGVLENECSALVKEFFKEKR